MTTYGTQADPRDFFTRAMNAKHMAEVSRDSEARWLADRVVDPDPAQAWRVEYAAIEYRRSLAALQYADAVYAVEAVRLRARSSVAAVEAVGS